VKLAFWRRRRGFPRSPTKAERNHISLPAVREPPPELLRELRKTDPTVDLHYFGRGRWVLGAVRPNSERRQIAGTILMQRRQNGFRNLARRLIPELGVQGFGFIGVWEIQGEPDGRISNEFRYTDYCYRRGDEPDWDAMEMSPVLSQEEMWDKYDMDYRVQHAYPTLFGKRKHYGPNRRQA